MADAVTKEWTLANKSQVMAMYKDHEDDDNGETFTLAIFIRSIEIYRQHLMMEKQVV